MSTKFGPFAHQPDGNMGQINNKVLTYDKNFLILKNYVTGFTKACTLRNSNVDVHCNNICLKKIGRKY